MLISFDLINSKLLYLLPRGIVSRYTAEKQNQLSPRLIFAQSVCIYTSVIDKYLLHNKFDFVFPATILFEFYRNIIVVQITYPYEESIMI